MALERTRNTHTQNSVDATVLFSQYLISYSGEDGGEKGERIIVLI